MTCARSVEANRLILGVRAASLSGCDNAEAKYSIATRGLFRSRSIRNGVGKRPGATQLPAKENAVLSRIAAILDGAFRRQISGNIGCP